MNVDAYRKSVGERQYLTLKCAMFGRLFVKAQEIGFDPDVFVDAFMQSPTAAILDEKYGAYDGRSVVYLIDEAAELMNIENTNTPPKYNDAVLEWIGWIYRWWNQNYEESSAEIQKEAPLQRMLECYPYHIMSPGMAVDRIKEGTANRKQNS